MTSLVLQPFTLSFLVASLLLDLLIAGAGSEGIFMSLAFGQSFVVAGWMVLGRGHRLLRAALFVAATLGIASLLALVLQRSMNDSYSESLGDALTFIALLAGSAVVLTLGWSLALRWLSAKLGAVVDAAAWRFPIIELLGWMIVVAVASAIMRLASTTVINGADVAYLVVIALVAALVMALLAGDPPRRGLTGVVIAAIAVAGLLAGFPLLVPQVRGEEVAMLAGAFAYVVLWIIVQRLDGRLAQRIDECVRNAVVQRDDAGPRRPPP